MAMFKSKDVKWAERAREATGNVWVVGLGMEMGMGTTGPKDEWSTIINAIEGEGWRLEHMTSVSPGANALYKTNGNVYATFRRVGS